MGSAEADIRGTWATGGSAVIGCLADCDVYYHVWLCVCVCVYVMGIIVAVIALPCAGTKTSQLTPMGGENCPASCDSPDSPSIAAFGLVLLPLKQ